MGANTPLTNRSLATQTIYIAPNRASFLHFSLLFGEWRADMDKATIDTYNQEAQSIAQLHSTLTPQRIYTGFRVSASHLTRDSCRSGIRARQ